ALLGEAGGQGAGGAGVEAGPDREAGREGAAAPAGGGGRRPDPQYSLFPSPYELLLRELGEVDLNSITPLEALNILDRLKKSISL
ncbi:MAG: hypothetical protein ACOC8N_09450, partial [Spirochaetota bacterium]